MAHIPSSSATDPCPSVPVSHRPHTCPPWIAWLLASPVRRLLEDPRQTLAPLVKPGSTVLEVGPGYGFYTLAAADLVGDGRVVCVDVQQPMLDEVGRRAARRGLAARVELRRVDDGELGEDLTGAVDLVLAINVVHESAAPAQLMASMVRTLRPGGRLLLIEPRGHCREDLFRAELDWGKAQGLSVREVKSQRMVQRAVLERLATPPR